MTYYYITTTDSTYYSNYSNTTTANDYFSDWTRSFTTAGTGTTHSPFEQQTYTVPYHTPFNHTLLPFNHTPFNHTPFIVRQEYYENPQGHRLQENHSQEPTRPQTNQKSPEQIKEEAEATERAKNLLLDYLDDDNKQKFLDKKHLEISSKLFKEVKYHIPLSKLGRIKAWKDDKIITELCLHVKEIEQLPIEDVVLTKLLHVMNDEANMLKTANHSNVKENLLLGLN